MELFDLIKRMFEDPEGYKEATKGDKKKFFFILQRRFAIQYPLQANVLNQLRINQEEAIDVWQRFLRKKYVKIPFWMFTKGVKKAKEAKEKKINISIRVVEEYAKKHRLDLKSVWEALTVFPKEMQKELVKFSRYMK